MCRRCEGYSWEQIEREEDLIIRTHGWMLSSVHNEDGTAWSYTVGLIESWGHPELIAIDFPFERQQALIHYLSAQVEKTSSIDLLDVISHDHQLVSVHRDNLATELIATWLNRYDRVPEHGEFLQIVPGASWYRHGHENRIRLLDEETPRWRDGRLAQLPCFDE